MTSTRTPPAARRLPARLVAVMVVLAALLVLSGSQCVAEMTADAHAAPGAAPATVLASGRGAGPATVVMPRPAGPLADPAPGSGDLGDALVLCLALLIAVVAAIAGSRRCGPWVITGRPARLGRQRRAVPPRLPSLAHLCVLRV